MAVLALVQRRFPALGARVRGSKARERFWPVDEEREPGQQALDA